jgi:hypothetical protein
MRSVIDEDRLRELRSSELDPPPLEVVLARGARLLKRRVRRRRLGVVTLCLALTAGTGVAIRAAVRHETQPVELAAPTGAPDVPGGSAEDCGGYAERRAPEAVDELRYLPRWLPPGREIEHAWARAELLNRENCPRVPVAVSAGRLAPGRDRIDASLVLEGPSPLRYRRYDGPTFVPVLVRGVEGDLVRFPGLDPAAALLQLRWTEPGGGSWLLQAGHVSEQELLAVADGLTLSTDAGSPPASAGWLPTGFEVTYQRDRPVTALPQERLWWHAVIEDGTTLSIDVRYSVPDDPPISRVTAGATGVRLLSIRGHEAVAAAEGAVVRYLRWEERPGVQITLSGELDLATLVRIAESLEPVAANDPRIKAP